jgi:hypothetical protein
MHEWSNLDGEEDRRGYRRFQKDAHLSVDSYATHLQSALFHPIQKFRLELTNTFNWTALQVTLPLQLGPAPEHPWWHGCTLRVRSRNPTRRDTLNTEYDLTIISICRWHLYWVRKIQLYEKRSQWLMLCEMARFNHLYRWISWRCVGISWD